MSGMVEEGWVVTQKKIFSRWCNAYLWIQLTSVEDIYTDFKSGVKLIKLIEVLSGEVETMKYRENPKGDIQELDNLNIAFKKLKKFEVKLNDINAKDVHEGNHKLILALCWALISHFQLGQISMEGISGKEGLLLWCQRVLHPYDDVKIDNFHRDWKDGKAFVALLHSQYPDCLAEHGGYETLINGNPEDRLNASFEAAEKFFDIKKMLDVEDILDVKPKPDEKIVLTYVTFFFKGFQTFKEEQNAAQSIYTAIDITKRHDKWIEEYAERALAFVHWTQETKEKYSNPSEGKDGHGDTTEKVKNTLLSFHEYKREVEPTKTAEHAKINGLLQTIHSSQRHNNRPLHQPEDWATPDSLDAYWEDMKSTVDSYDKHLLNSYSHFMKMDVLLMKINNAYEKVNYWVQQEKKKFDAEDYGQTAVLNEHEIENHELYKAEQEEYDKNPAEVEIMLKDLEIHADFGKATSQYETIKSKLDECRTKGAEHLTKLETVKVEYQKLIRLLEPEAWIQKQLKFFSDGNYGANLTEINFLIKDHHESYEVKLVKIKEQLAEVKANSAPYCAIAGVQVKKDQLLADLKVTEEYSVSYMQGLESNKQQFEELFRIIGLYNKGADQHMFQCDALEEDLSMPILKHSLETIMDSINEFNGRIRERMDSIIEKYADLDKWGRKLMESEIEEAESYNRHSLQALYDRLQEVEKKVDAKEEELREAYAHEESVKELCVNFKGRVEYLQSVYDMIIQETGNLDQEFETLQEKIDKVGSHYELFHGEAKEQFDFLESEGQQIEELGVVVNPYCSVNIFGMRAVWKELENVLKVTSDALESRRRAEDDNELSPEAYKEVKSMFDSFDVNGNGTISSDEFWITLTMMGVSMTEDKVKETFKELNTSGSGQLTFEEYIPFAMKQKKKPGFSQEDVLNAFKRLANPYPKFFPESKALWKSRADHIFHEDDQREYILNYFQEKEEPDASSTDDDPKYPYTGFVENIFTR